MAEPSDGRKRQPERADYGEASEPHCPVCGGVLNIELDQDTETSGYVCPRCEARLTQPSRPK